MTQSFGQWFAQFLLSTVTVVIGWIVVHNLTVKRDSDKNRREMVANSADALIESLNELLEKAIAYHVASLRNEVYEGGLKIGLQDLMNRVRSLRQISADISHNNACSSTTRAFWRAVTSKHFEDEHEGPLAFGDPQLQLIAAEADRAKQSLLNLKFRQFPIV